VAPTIANGLVEANLSAHDSHGVGVAARERARDGIPLPASTRAALAACARALGVAHFDGAFARR
jgi:LDH2 family malate/lactate/ureidoglycolate dehydrogenase